MLIFSSTTWSAKSSRPRAIAPTNTATECVCGSVGRYRDRRTVGASPESAARGSRLASTKEERRVENTLSLYVLGGRWSVTGFYIAYKSGTKQGEGERTTNLDDFEEFFWAVDAANRELVQQLD